MVKSAKKGIDVLAVSGGPDSVYLMHHKAKGRDIDKLTTYVIGHLDHGIRGVESDEDRKFVESLGRMLGNTVEVRRISLKGSGGKSAENSGRGIVAGLEEKARSLRYAFFEDLRKKYAAGKILLAHTADDQVETVLMRMLEGAGISGLKGIPRRTGGGIERPLLDTWREDIVDYLRRHNIPYRIDKSNFDTRFERNWVRHVLLPLLEKRYGKAVKKRIFALGERFREIDEFLEATVRRWMKRNVKPGPGAAVRSFRLPRAPYSKLPSIVRKKIVQTLCFEGMEIAPNERLLEAMDAAIVAGKPSTCLNIGKGASLSCRYGEAVFRTLETRETSGAQRAASEKLVVRELVGKPTPARLRRLAAGEKKAAFDADKISGPFAVRPLRAGDRIHPFGAVGAKKVKEILIDRKVPRDERWGRPVVCDASGEIVWIPGVVRSAIAPVTRESRRTLVLGVRGPSTTRKDVPPARVC